MRDQIVVTRDRLFRGFCILCLIFCASCRSTGKSGTEKTLAAVTIKGNTPGQIRNAAVEVFSRNGFKTVDSAPGKIVFEKKGSGMNNFVYGSWLGDDPVWVRVRAGIEPAGEMTFRLQCNAYMVRDRGGSTEEEIKLSRMHKGAYQKMLDEVSKRFDQK